MIEIHIIPIKKLYTLLEEASIDHSVAVIVSSEEIDSQKIPIPYIVEYFDDIDREISGRSMTLEQASRYAQFITGLNNSVSHIYCCCQSAQSRSTAIASALYKYYGENTLAYSSIWKDLKYSPNPCVFLLLCEALGVSFEYVEFDALIEANRQAIRKAIQRFFFCLSQLCDWDRQLFFRVLN